MDHWQRHLAFAQVPAHRLAEGVFVTREIEQVIDDLERHADVDPVVPQRVLLLARRRRAEHAADLGRPGKQEGGLTADDVEVLFFAEIDDAVLGQLVDLAFDDAQGDVAEQPDDVEAVLGQRQRHRLEIQEVAEQHRDVVAPAGVHRLTAASQLRLVDDVVVHQRRGVDEFDDRCVQHGAIAGVTRHPGRHQQHSRADALAAAVLDVAADRRDQRHLRLDVTRELALDLAEIATNGLEQLREGRGGRFLRDGIQAGLCNYNILDERVSTREGAVNPRHYWSYGLNSRWKFSSAASAIAAGVSPRSPAIRSATRTTCAGSLRVPR